MQEPALLGRGELGVGASSRVGFLKEEALEAVWKQKPKEWTVLARVRH